VNAFVVPLALACTLLAGCTDRARPGPSELPVTFNLTADVVSPRTATTVVAGRTVAVLVHGSEPGARLTGLAYVARRFDNNALIDSAGITFPARQDTSYQFQLHVPPTLQTNAQIDLYAIAFGGNQQTTTSTPKALVVLNCPVTDPCGASGDVF
jgi:hypothetical protein